MKVKLVSNKLSLWVSYRFQHPKKHTLVYKHLLV